MGQGERWEDQGAHPAGVGSGETPRPRGESAEVGSIPSLSESVGVTGTHTSLSIFVSASFSKTAP